MIESLVLFDYILRGFRFLEERFPLISVSRPILLKLILFGFLSEDRSVDLFTISSWNEVIALHQILDQVSHFSELVL